MNSPRPYLIQALLDWIVDNGCTPYMAIACDVPGVQAPVEHAADGKLVLNVSATATRNLTVGEGRVSVDCRFRGRPVHVSVPVGAVVAVFAHENGLGMSFDAESAEPPPAPPPPEEKQSPRRGPTLKVVK